MPGGVGKAGFFGWVGFVHQIKGSARGRCKDHAVFQEQQTFPVAARVQGVRES